MPEPFDDHDARIRRTTMRLIRSAQENFMAHKASTEAAELLERSLIEWKDDCPGAGWEHHCTAAVVTLAMTPAMTQLLHYAAIGMANEVEELRHIADRVYDSNPEAQAVRKAYVVAAKEAERA